MDVFAGPKSASRYSPADEKTEGVEANPLASRWLSSATMSLIRGSHRRQRWLDARTHHRYTSQRAVWVDAAAAAGDEKAHVAVSTVEGIT